MPDATTPRRHLAWIHSLRLQIVAIAVATAAVAAVAAVVAAHVVLVATERHLQRLLVQEQSDDAERTATLLGTKVDMLREALKATARQTPAPLWDDPQAMQQHLVGNPALGSLFENVLAARPTGELLGRLAMGRLSDELPRIADRPYFQQALRTDQPVISGPLSAKTDRTPVVALAISSQGAGGDVLGVLVGVLALSQAA